MASRRSSTSACPAHHLTSSAAVEIPHRRLSTGLHPHHAVRGDESNMPTSRSFGSSSSDLSEASSQHGIETKPVEKKKSLLNKFKQSFRRKKSNKTLEGGSPNFELPDESTEELPDISTPDLSNLHYSQHDNASPYGRGVFILITLFTGSLPGYRVDRERLLRFFKDLDFVVFESPENCTRKELLAFLQETRDIIQADQNSYDRFFCAILSHGLKDGIMTCKDVGGHMEEELGADVCDLTEEVSTLDVPASPSHNTKEHHFVLTKVEEIVDIFKHDKLRKLKNSPKIFLIQACQGMEVVKAAGKVHERQSKEQGDAVPATEKNDMLQPSVPVDADIEICFACTSDNMSFVDDHEGSWFIRAVVDTFRDYKTHLHVSDMLTMVRNKVAERRKRFIKDQTEDGHQVRGTAIQMPCSSTTLRKQLWLENRAVEVLSKSRHMTHAVTSPSLSSGNTCGLPTPLSPHVHTHIHVQHSPHHHAPGNVFTFANLPDGAAGAPAVTYLVVEDTSKERQRKYSQQVTTCYGTPPDTRGHLVTYSQSEGACAHTHGQDLGNPDFVQRPRVHSIPCSHDHDAILSRIQQQAHDNFQMGSPSLHEIAIPEVDQRLETDGGGSGDATPLAEKTPNFMQTHQDHPQFY